MVTGKEWFVGKYKLWRLDFRPLGPPLQSHPCQLIDGEDRKPPHRVLRSYVMFLPEVKEAEAGINPFSMAWTPTEL